MLTTSCRAPGSTLPVIKVGLIAPFEGVYRPLGYEVYFAAWLAVQEWNASGRVQGWGVELVAVDDGLDPAQTIGAAGKLAVDPDVVAVIGPFSVDTSDVALPILAAAGIPTLVLAPVPEAVLNTYHPLAVRFYGYMWLDVGQTGYAKWSQATAAPDLRLPEPFVAAYHSLAGRAPGPHALLAYDATQALLAAVATSIHRYGRPTRPGVADALGHLQIDGLIGEIQLQDDGTVVGLPTEFFVTPTTP